MIRPLFWKFAPLLAYGALVLALCWPLPAEPGSWVLGDPRHPGFSGDLFFQYSMQRQLDAGQLPDLSHTPVLGHPVGLALDSRVTLSLHLWLYAAAMTVLDLLPARNLVALLVLALNGLAMHLLARRRWGREDLAYLCGLLFALSPYLFVKVNQGFVQKTVLFFIPLFFMYFFEVLAAPRPRLRHQLGLLLSLGGALLVYPPYGICCLGVALPLALASLVKTRNGQPPGSSSEPSGTSWWGHLGRHGPLWLGAATMLAAVAFYIRDDPRTAPGPLPPLEHLGGYLHGYNPFLFRPYGPAFDFVGLAELQQLSMGFPLLLTLFALVAALWGLRGARLWVGLCLAMLVVMLGPYAPGSEQLPEAERTRLPFYYLCQLPFGSLLYFPIRLAPWVLLGLLLCGGDALVQLQRRLEKRFNSLNSLKIFRYLVPAVLVLSLAEHRLLFPEYRQLLRSRPPHSRFVQTARADGRAALYLLPPEPVVPNAFLQLAVTTGKNLVNGYIKRPGPLPFPGAEADADQQRRFADGLRARDVGFVVLLKNQLPDPEQRPGPDSPYPWLQAQFGPPRYLPKENLLVYRVEKNN